MPKKSKKSKKINNKKSEAVKIAEYLVSGGAFFWSGYITFFILDQFLGLNLWWAKLFANLTGWTVNYALQRYWVFNNPKLKKHQTQVTERYIILTIINFVIDYIIVAALKQIGITPYIGQIVSAGFFTIWNYLWYRFWVFPDHSHKHKRIATV